jgi:hypothetical protein
MSRRVLLAFVLSFALAMASCSKDDSTVRSERQKDGAADPAAAADDSYAAAEQGGSSQGQSASKPGGGGASSKATSPGADTSSASAAATPIPQGTYSYDTDGDVTISGGAPRPLPSTTLLTASAPSGATQRSIRDLRDSEGMGTVTETDLVYQPEGVYISRVKVTVNFPGGLTDVRELKPDTPALIAPTGGGPGFSTSFVLKGSGTTADVTVKALRNEKLTIAGGQVETVVVEVKIVFSGALTGQQNSTAWILQKNLLTVKEQVSSDIQNGPIRAVTNYQATLKSLTP